MTIFIYLLGVLCHYVFMGAIKRQNKGDKMKKKTLIEKAGMKKFSVAAATKPELKKRIKRINSILQNKKINSYLRKKLTDHRWACEQKLKTSLSKKRKPINKNQMHLPGFLRQMDIVRFEELIANKVREEIASLVKPARKTSKKSA